ncbi:MAG: phage terminase large subunit [Methyloversatilis discipulorum]|uniref:phage terminase large subunit n=1 Tax=Methyloversatilis discipulorum TaxID=1119528 RepID=UPI0026EC8904|nr:phage terminase large subunit [Methyloversatilis discipulorum]MBT9516713.1 phage terminase large subunit [Methyloversatilis discipulorum]
MRQFSEDERFAAAQMAREDLYYFARWMFLQRKGFKWMRAPHHRVICAALERVFNGESRRLIINIPPRYSKTELVINWVAWCLGKVPDSEFIMTSYSGALATNNAWVARELIQHEAYQQIFPGTRLRTDSSAKGEWRTTANGIVYASGAGGTITGYGAGKHRPGFGGAIIIDDPHKPDEATSDVMRQNVIDWFQNTLESRKNDPAKTPIILIMQRVHEKDLAGWLIGGGNGEQWERVTLPAECDSEDDPLGREIGAALWPEKHDERALAVLRSASSYVYAAQYQQRPAPLGGGLLRGEWFRRYRTLPRIMYRKIYADTAQKTKEHNDYSVLECWGRGEDGNAYLVDLIRGKWMAPELKRRTVDFWEKHNAWDTVQYGGLRALMVEDKASGTGLIQDLSMTSSIPVLPIERHTDKLTRVMDVQGYVESGRAYIPEEASWVSEFIAECEAFTPNDTHAHDDQIDPMCDALKDMVAAGNILEVFARLAEG